MLLISPSVTVINRGKVVLLALLFLAGCLGLVSGVWWLWRGSVQICVTENANAQEGANAHQNAAHQATSSAHLAISTVPQLYADIAGAVEKPGVYQLNEGARLAALIEKAGGFAKTADPQFISQELNLAKQLQDGDKLYIYTKQEAAQRRQAETQSSSQPSTTLPAAVSINSASQTELESLPGIGEKRAADIIANRPYGSLNELVTKKLVTETLFNDIQSHLKL